MSGADLVREVVRAPLAALGLDLADVTVATVGRRRTVRVLVERSVSGLAADDVSSPVAPVDLDEVTEATRVVSDTLDEAEPLGDAPYLLEVSSAGVDRPLRSPAQFRRNVGRLVEITRTAGGTVTGRIRAVRPDGVELAGAGAPLRWDEVDRGKVQVEFGRTEPDEE